MANEDYCVVIMRGHRSYIWCADATSDGKKTVAGAHDQIV